MYYYKEVMKRKLKERVEKLNNSIRFNKNKLRKNNYKLFDVEFADPEVEVSIPAVESKNEVSTGSTPVVNKNKTSRRNTKDKKKKKKKGIITAAIALAMAGVMAASGFLIASKLKKKDDTDLDNSKSISTNMDTADLDSLGEQLPTEGKKSEYTKVSGDFNIEDIVRGADGRLYVDEESAKNAAKSGSVHIDTKGGTLTVDGSGKVYTQSEGYEIVDENGNVVESGQGSPSDYEEGIDYVECPCNYYDDEGTLVHSAGEFITPEELELCKTYYHTSKPAAGEYDKVEEEIIYEDGYSEEDLKDEGEPVGSNSDSKEETAEEDIEEEVEYVEEDDNTNTSSNQGVTNADGTYTIYGVTYASYADYQQYIIDGGVGYGYIDGIIQPIGDYEIEYQYTK